MLFLKSVLEKRNFDLALKPFVTDSRIKHLLKGEDIPFKCPSLCLVYWRHKMVLSIYIFQEHRLTNNTRNVSSFLKKSLDGVYRRLISVANKQYQSLGKSEMNIFFCWRLTNFVVLFSIN